MLRSGQQTGHGGYLYYEFNPNYAKYLSIINDRGTCWVIKFQFFQYSLLE